MAQDDGPSRTVLPIPDIQPVGLTSFDAKDPDTHYPPIKPLRPNTCAPLAETLRLNAYATAQFGKCHEVPVWEISPMGPFDSWPTVASYSP